MAQVFRLDIPLDAENPGEQFGDSEDVTHESVEDPIQKAVEFLARFKTAKIVVVFDTHSVDNGAFIWRGNSADKSSLESCYMLEVGVS